MHRPIRLKIPAWWFARRWVCGVVRSGFHNGVACSPTTDPPHHEAWRCGWRYELSVTAEDWRRLTGVEE